MSEDKDYSVRTDLAYEAREMYVEEEQRTSEIKGVKSRQYKRHDIKVNHIEISAKGEETIQKKRGSYITIFADGVKEQDTARQAKAVKVLAENLQQLLAENGVEESSKGLIVGLGNWNVTPDALGPITVEEILVTNHLFELEFETVADVYRDRKS